MSWSDFSSQPSRPPAGVTVDVCCWPLPAPLSSSDPPGNRTTATKRGRRWRTPWIGPGRSCRWTTCSMPWRSISDLFLDTSMARFAAPWARWRNWGNREATRVGVTLRCRIQCWSNTFHWGFSVVVSLFHFRCQVVMGQDSGPWYSGVSPSNEIIGFFQRATSQALLHSSCPEWAGTEIPWSRRKELGAAVQPAVRSLFRILSPRRQVRSQLQWLRWSLQRIS